MSPDVPSADDVEQGLRIAKGTLDALAPIGRAIGRRRAARAERQAEQILERAGLDEQELADRMEADDATSALVEDVLEVGATTPHDEKRRLLAAVVAQALAGGAAPTDHHRQLLRTVAELEPLDVHYLAEFRKPGQEPSQHRMLVEKSNQLAAPAAAALIRAGIVLPSATSNDLGTPVILTLTEYGNLFLTWLIQEPGAQGYFAPPP